MLKALFMGTKNEFLKGKGVRYFNVEGNHFCIISGRGRVSESFLEAFRRTGLSVSSFVEKYSV